MLFVGFTSAIILVPCSIGPHHYMRNGKVKENVLVNAVGPEIDILKHHKSSLIDWEE